MIRPWDIFLSKDNNIYEHIEYLWFAWAWTLKYKNIDTWVIQFVDVWGELRISDILDRKIWKVAPRYIKMFWYKYILTK